MSDLIDEGNETAELMRQVALQNATAGITPDVTGFCLNCDAVIGGFRWCDSDCRDDWEKANR